MSTGGTIGPPRWGLYSTRLVGDQDVAVYGSTTPFVPGDISSASPARISAQPACAYCGSLLTPWTFTNCPNCGAPRRKESR